MACCGTREALAVSREAPAVTLLESGLEWGAHALQNQLATELPGLQVQVQMSVDSTNTRLLERCRALDGAPFEPHLLIAEDQTAGRGRLGRTWISAPGASLTFSLAMLLPRAELSGLSLAVGVALAEALDVPGAAPPRVLLKWPNDLWLRGAPGDAHPVGRKLGGVLIETASCGAQRIGVIGVGLNVLPLAVPDPSSGVACLQEIDPRISAPQALHRLALPLVRALRRFQSEGFAAFEQAFARRDLLFGHDVAAAALHGVAQGVVASSGALRLRCGVGAHVQWHDIVSGEVSVRLQPAPAKELRCGQTAPHTSC
jgi:BirA family transcriptional regulator, biotin operon repressor / biotin---[acetyl-CoA-carboxylase] ligase